MPIFILMILGDIICDNYIIQVFNSQSRFIGIALFIGFLITQIFSSPFQAGFSDLYCRKNSLLISISLSVLSLILAFFYIEGSLTSIYTLILILIIKGIGGNTVPISWAAIADTQKRDFRFSLALALSAYALGYLILSLFQKFLNNTQSIALAISILCVALALCARFLYDIQDLRSREVAPEFAEMRKGNLWGLIELEEVQIKRRLHKKSLLAGLIAFALWGTSLYSILILLVDFHKQYPTIPIVMMCGYLIGVIIMRFCKSIKDEHMILIGYGVSILFLLILMSFILFDHITNFTLSVCYFFYSMGNSFLSPTMLSLLCKDQRVHERGKRCGFVESADTIGLLFASIAILICVNIKTELNLIAILSFITFVISWIPYWIYQKLRAAKD